MKSEFVSLALTGPDSHRLERKPGVGSLSVGPGGGKHRPDLIVAPDTPVDWHAFDGMQTGSGGAWPRWITYEGNDLSLFRWMRERRTETVTFVPCSDAVVDARDARLGELTVRPGAHRVALVVPAGLRKLRVAGDPARVVFEVPPGGEWPVVQLQASGGAAIETIAHLEHLRGVRSLHVSNRVSGPPFDLRCLAALEGLHSLELHGDMAHAAALAELSLEALALRYVRDLTGLPPLASWPDLRHFVAWNVDGRDGKALRAQARKVRKTSEGFFSVSKLRSQRWFVEEHGLPFGAWPRRTASKAAKAYKAASKALVGVTDAAEAEAIVRAFVSALNALPGLETSEREDAARAVALLAETHPEAMAGEEASAWFDAERDF